MKTIDLGETVTILKSDYEGLQGVCRHYHDTLNKVTAQRDELLSLVRGFVAAYEDRVDRDYNEWLTTSIRPNYRLARAAIAKAEGSAK